MTFARSAEFHFYTRQIDGGIFLYINVKINVWFINENGLLPSENPGITLFREAYTIALTIPILTNYCYVIHSEFFYLNPKKMRL